MNERREWRCWFCNEVFTDTHAARQHFGAREDQEPGCVAKVNAGGERGLLNALRRTEQELYEAITALHTESTEAMQAMREMQGRHAAALRLAEEAGYQRGIEDMRKELQP